jgi:hypothetical protein
MRTDDFWLIVHRTRRDLLRGDAPSLTALTTELQRLGETAIDAFESHARQQVAELDLPALRDVATQLWVISDDSWLHFRAWCVGQGREFVAQVVAEPSRVLRRLAGDRAGPFDAPNGELFLYCADYARVARTKAVA